MSGRFVVGDDPRTWPTADCAISFAQDVVKLADGDRSVYVREIGNPQAVARVERRGATIFTSKT